MLRYVVSQVSLYDMDLVATEVYADNWQEALAECNLEFALTGAGATDLDEAKSIAYDADTLFELTLIE